MAYNSSSSNYKIRAHKNGGSRLDYLPIVIIIGSIFYYGHE